MLLLLLEDTSVIIEIPFPVLPLPPEYFGGHVAQANSQMLEQFKNSTLLLALLESWTSQVQLSEELIAPLVVARDVDTAIGVTLDSLGEAVGVERRGQSDDVYRLFIRAKVLINSSSGTPNELIAIVRQLAGEPTLGVALDEYDRATVYIRPKDLSITEDADIWAALLQLAKSAGIFLAFVHNIAPLDADTWHFSSGPGSDLSASYGFGNGDLAGVITNG